MRSRETPLTIQGTKALHPWFPAARLGAVTQPSPITDPTLTIDNSVTRALFQARRALVSWTGRHQLLALPLTNPLCAPACLRFAPGGSHAAALTVAVSVWVGSAGGWKQLAATGADRNTCRSRQREHDL